MSDEAHAVEVPETQAAETSTAVLHLAADIEEAIRLREMFFQRDIDHAFERAGGSIIYAVDANILNALFLSPQGSSAKRVHQALRLFHGPEGSKSSGDEVKIF